MKVDAGSSLWALEEAITQDQILKGQQDVAKHLIETNVQLLPMNSALAELVNMGRDEIASDARREKREIKEDARALEDRRDANKKGLDKKGSSGSSGSSGSPTLNKEGEEGGLTQSEGILSAISAYFMGKAGGLTNMIKKGFKFAFKPVALLGTALGFKAATPTPTGTPTVTPTPVGDPRVKPTGGKAQLYGKGTPIPKPPTVTSPKVPDVPTKEMSKLAKTTTKWAKGFTKFASRAAKTLFPIDIIGKMEQGQGFWESMGNMVYEVGQLGVGGVDWVSEKVTGGEGLLSAKASDYIIKSGDILGNEGKWNTHWIERGINTTMAAWTGTEREADKKQWTEEQKQLAIAAENELGAVDIGFGQGQIESLEKLTLLDPKSLEALLAYQVWSDKDQKLIEDIRDAKVQGRPVKYNDNGLFGFESVDFGESPTVKASRLNRGLGDNVSGRRDIRGGPGNAADPTVADE
ncbi:MAG: hypothetical protein QGG48_10295, partial [Desulfatiglandales bacterium]|nr:hypothetical protein [Desulfatiglandales bacterium]